MEECIFCKIIKGELSAHTVYEDAGTLAFLDIHPIRPGHVLVVPKLHEPDFYRLSDEVYGAVMGTVKKMAVRISDTVRPEKVGLVVAGWDVPHAHVHVVPMHDYHDITSKRLQAKDRTDPTEDELKHLAEMLRA